MSMDVNNTSVSMKCENCKSDEIEEEIIETVYRYNDYFQEYLKEDMVQFKCKKCEFIWIESI